MTNAVKKIPEEDKKVTIEPLDHRLVNGLDSLYAFASSDKGEKLISMFISKNAEKHKWQLLPKYIIGGLAIILGCILSFYGKFDASIAVLLGSVVGYVLGKDSNN